MKIITDGGDGVWVLHEHFTQLTGTCRIMSNDRQ